MKSPAVIFDLGNVILLFDYRRMTKKLSQAYGLDEETIHQTLIEPKRHSPLETGQIQPAEFIRECFPLLHAKLPTEQLKEIWCNIFWENWPVIEMINALRGKVTLLLLSNSNAWHIDYVKSHFNVLEPFDHLVFSHEVGLRKPDPRIYQHALNLAGNCAPVVYVDDIPEYVNAATQLGITAIHYTDPAILKSKLTTLGLLDSPTR